MLYRTIPQNGDRLSILGHGCMRFATEPGGGIDEGKAIRQIRYSVDNGVNYFDTAWPYHGGQSEVILGKALREGYRERVKIATKLPTWLINSRQDMESYLERQLEKLETDRIDYYLLHALNGQSWRWLVDLGVADFLDKACADGRIVNPGFSFHGYIDDFKTIVDGYPWIFCQIQYNFLDQLSQAGTEGLKYAAAHKLGVIVMEPLRGGNLGLQVAPPAIAELWRTSATPHTPVEWALRWVWDHPEVTVVLSGMNEDEHIKENIAIAASAEPGSLSSAELELVDRVAEKYTKLMKAGCTGCGYCMPCPEGVLIPVIFEVYNQMHLFGGEAAAKNTYLVRTSGVISGNKPGYASRCTQCGECLEKCPQGIEIPVLMTEIAKEMESSDMEEQLKMISKLLKAEG